MGGTSFPNFGKPSDGSPAVHCGANRNKSDTLKLLYRSSSVNDLKRCFISSSCKFINCYFTDDGLADQWQLVISYQRINGLSVERMSECRTCLLYGWASSLPRSDCRFSCQRPPTWSTTLDAVIRQRRGHHRRFSPHVLYRQTSVL